MSPASKLFNISPACDGSSQLLVGHTCSFPRHHAITCYPWRYGAIGWCAAGYEDSVCMIATRHGLPCRVP